jgi:hypothetical protein
MRSIYVILLLALTSCATIRNKKTTVLNISTPEYNTKIVYKDSTYDLPQALELKRSRKPLVLNAVRDSVSHPYIIRAKGDGWFRYGNLMFLTFPPAGALGYLVDYTNPRRYYYGRELVVNTKEEDTVFIHPVRAHSLGQPLSYFRKDFAGKGDYLTISVPIFDHMYLQPRGYGDRALAGYFGFSIGYEHYYTKHKAVGIRAGFMPHVDEAPVMDSWHSPVSSDETTFGFYLTAFKKHHYNREAFSYGINFSQNFWKHEDYLYKNLDSTESVTYGHTRPTSSLGVELAAYHYLNRVIQVGLIYRPTFLTVMPAFKMMYQHTISVDVAFRFNTKKEEKVRKAKPVRDRGIYQAPVKIEKLPK